MTAIICVEEWTVDKLSCIRHGILLFNLNIIYFMKCALHSA